MSIAYIGLGSNLGESKSILQNSISRLATEKNIRLLKISSLYASKPLGEKNQPNYINAVISVSTQLSPHQLLQLLQEIELEFGRERTHERWASRTLDMDILLYNQLICLDERLTLPHPEMTQRDFVLVPLCEIAPDTMIPGIGDIETVLKACDIRGLEKL